VIPEILLTSTSSGSEEKRVNQQADANPDPEPTDARKATEEQRELQNQLEHQDDGPDGPGSQQTGDDIADESSR
jgi:hypothetical protein